MINGIGKATRAVLIGWIDVARETMHSVGLAMHERPLQSMRSTRRLEPLKLVGSKRQLGPLQSMRSRENRLLPLLLSWTLISGESAVAPLTLLGPMMDDSNTGQNLELGGRVNSCLANSWLFGKGVAHPKIEAADQCSLFNLVSSQAFGRGSGGGM